MELMPGYKQTEVGVIPEDWEVSSLRNCCSKITDGTHDTPKPVSSGVPFLTAIHVKDNWIDYESCLYVTRSDHEIIFRRCNPEKDDVLMVNIGAGVATTALVNVDYEFSLKNVALLKPNRRRMAGAYLNYALAHKKQKITQGLSSGGAQPFLSLTQIGEITIPLPSTKAEQEAIAEVLSKADALIETLGRLIAQKRLLKKGVMQQLLTGKRRLPGFANATTGYKQTEVGMIHEDWDCVRIGESIDLLTGFPFPSRSYSKSGVRLLRGSNVKRGVTDWSEEGTEYWPAISSEIRKYVLKSGDIVIAMDGSLVGRSFAMLSESDVPALLLQRVARIRSSVIDQKFLKAWICGQRFTEHCDAVKTVTAIPHISPADIRSFTIALPPTKAEQEAIGAILFNMDTETALLEAQLAKYRQLKQGLMQKLLTGRIRLI